MPKVRNTIGGNWALEELEECALFLADENCFAVNLETLALKKTVSAFLHQMITKFDQKIKPIDLIQKNVVSNQYKISHCVAFFEVVKLF